MKEIGIGALPNRSKSNPYIDCGEKEKQKAATRQQKVKSKCTGSPSFSPALQAYMLCQSWGWLAMGRASCPCGRKAGWQGERNERLRKKSKKQTGQAGVWQQQIGWLTDGPRWEAEGRKEMSGDGSLTDKTQTQNNFTFTLLFFQQCKHFNSVSC